MCTPGKFDELLLSLYSLANIQIIIVTETWFHSNIDTAYFSIPRFEFYHYNRKFKTGGGVCMWLHNDLLSSQLETPLSVPDNIECCFVHFKANDRVCIICAVYIPPHVCNSIDKCISIEYFLVDCFDFFLKSDPDAHIFVTSDFNTFCVDSLVSNLVLVDINTNKVSTRYDSILDYILISEDIACFYHPVETLAPIATNDHKLLLAKSKQNSTKTNLADTWNSMHVLYDFRRSNLDIFVNLISSIDFSPIYSMDNVDDKIAFFYICLRNCMRIIPSHTVVLTNKDKPWITPLLKHLINLRWNAYRSKNYNLYRHYRYKIKNEISNAKIAYYNKLTRNSRNRGLWSFVKNIKGIVNRPFDSLFNDFDSIDSTVNNINSHFASFFNKDSINISEYPIDKKSGDDCLELVDEFDVYRYLSRLPTHKAIGADGIPNIIYREASIFCCKAADAHY